MYACGLAAGSAATAYLILPDKPHQNAFAETASRSSVSTGPVLVAYPFLTIAHHKISGLNSSSKKNAAGVSHRAARFVSVAFICLEKLSMFEKCRNRHTATLARARAACSRLRSIMEQAHLSGFAVAPSASQQARWRLPLAAFRFVAKRNSYGDRSSVQVYR